MYEIYDVIDLIKRTFETSGKEKVLHTEPGIMHTVRIGKETYKAIKNLDGWKVTMMK